MTGAVFAMAMPLALGACGSESDDFSVYVERSPDAVLGSLAKVDASGTSEFGAKPITRSLTDGGIIEYKLPADGGYDDGIVRFTVSADEKRGSKVAVMVDVPAVKSDVAGGQMVVSERKVEKVLKDDLKKLAENLETGSSGDFATVQLEASLVSIAIVLQNKDTGGSASLFDAGSNEDSWGESQTDFADNGSAMSDPNEDASSYGAPTNDGSGYDDDGGWGN
jgi:hypothetical protein